jgi:putative transposase
VLGHLPERDQPLVRRRLRAAWALEDHDRALDQLRALADELTRSHPGAAASLREGMEETLTVTRLGARGRLKRTLARTGSSTPASCAVAADAGAGEGERLLQALAQ